MQFRLRARFVYVCHEAAQNGRYTLLLNDASDPHMLDTRTGAYYSLRGGKVGAILVRFNLSTGDMRQVKPPADAKSSPAPKK